jgi:hypothetical protein
MASPRLPTCSWPSLWQKGWAREGFSLSVYTPVSFLKPISLHTLIFLGVDFRAYVSSFILFLFLAVIPTYPAHILTGILVDLDHAMGYYSGDLPNTPVSVQQGAATQTYASFEPTLKGTFNLSSH